jgi:YHS domain-containing protein
MQGLFSLLLFAAFFYLMMRFGCGAHMIHGSHGRNEDSGSGAPATDPVCGMAVPREQGYSESYRGEMYRFCSRACLDKFDADPGRYVSQKGELR